MPTWPSCAGPHDHREIKESETGPNASMCAYARERGSETGPNASMCVYARERGSGRGKRWDAGTVWASASIAFSALLYLFDFSTNISALRTYYGYGYQCPHAPLGSSLLRDPICRAIRSGQYHHGSHAFWVCLICLAVAHLTYALVFWLTLDPRQHPFRLAYFLPLIHLHRLLKLLSHNFSRKDLKELLERQKETSSLFYIIGASTETAPQFCVQIAITMRLGEHKKASLDPTFRAQRIPINLVLSLIASMLSGTFSTSLAVLPLVKKSISLVGRAYFGLLTGVQTLAAMIAKAMCIAILTKYSTRGYLISLLISTTSEITIPWIFIDLVLQSHQYNDQVKSKYSRLAHSFGLAIMTRLVGPIYVIIKFSKSPTSIVWGTLSHILVEVMGFIVVLFLPSHIDKDHEQPCNYFHHKNRKSIEINEYFSCEALVTTFFISLFIIALTTLQLFCLQSSTFATRNPCNTQNRPIFSQTKAVNELYPPSKKSQSDRLILSTLLLFVVWILFIQELQKNVLYLS